MASEGYHESLDALTAETLDMHRGLASLIEELEAVDWYQQRIDAARDEDLQHILAHNRDEEKEHAAMLLEWLRRRDANLEQQLRSYLFTDGAVTEVGHEDGDAAGGGGESAAGSLQIGSLRDAGGRP